MKSLIRMSFFTLLLAVSLAVPAFAQKQALVVSAENRTALASKGGRRNDATAHAGDVVAGRFETRIIRPELVADNLLTIFKQLYGKYIGPRSADILYASLLTLAQRDDASLVTLPLLLTNAGVRRSQLRHAFSALVTHSGRVDNADGRAYMKARQQIEVRSKRD